MRRELHQANPRPRRNKRPRLPRPRRRRRARWRRMRYGFDNPSFFMSFISVVALFLTRCFLCAAACNSWFPFNAGDSKRGCSTGSGCGILTGGGASDSVFGALCGRDSWKLTRVTSSIDDATMNDMGRATVDVIRCWAAEGERGGNWRRADLRTHYSCLLPLEVPGHAGNEKPQRCPHRAPPGA